MKLIEVAGNGREIGRQTGEALRDEALNTHLDMMQSILEAMNED